jgi:CBS domain-containing protein
MEARHVMTSPVLTISPGASVRQAIALMLEKRISGLPVVDDIGQLVGLISEGDLLHRSEIGTEQHRSKWLDFLLGPGRSATDYVQSHSRRVADIMTTDLATVEETTPLEEVVKLMEKRRIKRVPVVRDGGVAGMVTRSDLLRAFLKASAQPIGQLSDEDIAQNIYTEIAQHGWAPAGNVHVKVIDGHVTLSGTIFDMREGDAIRVCAENQAGVTGVTDEMIWIEPTAGQSLSPIL